MSALTIEKGKELEAAREVAYFFNDPQLGEPFPIYKVRETAWWMTDDRKVDTLFRAFKHKNTVKQACYITGITYEQFRYFVMVHPKAYDVIRMYKGVVAIRLKEIILEAAIGNEEKNIAPDPGLAVKALRFFEEPEDDPELTGGGLVVIPPGGSKITTVSEAFLNDKGELVMSRQMAERINKHGPNTEPSAG